MAETKIRRKQSVYLPPGMLEEIRELAARKDRSFSWLLQQAWRLAKADLSKLPELPRRDAG